MAYGRFSGMGLGQENQLEYARMRLRASLCQKFSGRACSRTPLFGEYLKAKLLEGVAF